MRFTMEMMTFKLKTDMQQMNAPNIAENYITYTLRLPFNDVQLHYHRHIIVL